MATEEKKWRSVFTSRLSECNANEYTAIKTSGLARLVIVCLALPIPASLVTRRVACQTLVSQRSPFPRKTKTPFAPGPSQLSAPCWDRVVVLQKGHILTYVHVAEGRPGTGRFSLSEKPYSQPAARCAPSAGVGRKSSPRKPVAARRRLGNGLAIPLTLPNREPSPPPVIITVGSVRLHTSITLSPPATCVMTTRGGREVGEVRRGSRRLGWRVDL